MADAPTIGGYRVAGAVISADLGALAQRLPGETITLEKTSVERAQRELARAYERLSDVRAWSLG
jgi:allophanate hydrolase subunit 2